MVKYKVKEMVVDVIQTKAQHMAEARMVLSRLNGHDLIVCSSPAEINIALLHVYITYVTSEFYNLLIK